MEEKDKLSCDLSPSTMYSNFVKRIRQNLHLVLTMSSIGDAFRNRLRKFPSLLSCCTIDWFHVSFVFIFVLLKIITPKIHHLLATFDFYFTHSRTKMKGTENKAQIN